MIYNEGIMGVLNLTFIDNSTWLVKKGSTLILYAHLIDDMGNTATGQNISFYINGTYFVNVTSIEGYANMTYNFPSNNILYTPISGEDAGNGNYDILINNELLRLKIPTIITLSVPDNLTVGDTVTIESRLTDEDENILPGAIVDFYVDGKKIGSALTDEYGIARVNHTLIM